MSSIKAQLKSAKECIDKLEFKEACKICKDILKEDKSNFFALFFIGYACYKLHQFETSEQGYKKSLQIQPTNLQSWFGLIELYEQWHKEQNQKSQELQESYEKVLDLLQQQKPDQYEKKWSNFAEKFVALVPDPNQTKLDLLQQLSSSESNLELKIKYLENIVDPYMLLEEEHVMQQFLDIEIQNHLQQLREREEKRLLKSKGVTKLSKEELKKLMPPDSELLPEVKESSLRQEWKSTAYVKLLSEAPQGRRLDTQIETMIQLSPLLTSPQLHELLIQRNIDRFVHLQQDSYKQKALQQMQLLLQTHKNYFSKQLLLWEEEDDFSLSLSLYKKRIMYSHPYEGISILLIASELFDNQFEEEELMEQLEIIIQKGIDLCPEYIFGYILWSQVVFYLKKYQKVLQICSMAMQQIDKRISNQKSKLSNQLLQIQLLEAQVYLKLPNQYQKAQLILQDILSKQPNHYKTLYTMATYLMERKDYDKAMELFTIHSQLFSQQNDSQLECLWGTLYLQCNQFENALHHLQLALQYANNNKNNNNIYLIYHTMALVYWKSQTQFQECVTLLLKSAQANPQFAPNFTYLGLYYLQINKDEQRAIKCFKKSISINPMEQIAGELLGQLYQQSQQFTLAAQLYREVTQQNPRAYWAWKRLAFYEQSQQNWDQCLFCFQHALRYGGKEDLDCYEGLGYTYSKQGKYLASVRAFKKALELTTDDQLEIKEQLLCQLGHTYYLLSEYDMALHYFEQIQTITNSILFAKYKSDTLYQLSQLKFQQGLFEECIRLIDESIQLIQHYSQDYLTICLQIALYSTFYYSIPICKNKNSKLEMGIQCLEYALHHFEMDFETHCDVLYQMSILYFYTSNHSASISYLKQCIQKNPKHIDAWNALAIIWNDHYSSILTKQHCFIRALQYSTTAKYFYIWNNLATLYLTQMEYSLAQECFVMAQNSNPLHGDAFCGVAMLNELKLFIEQSHQHYEHALLLHPYHTVASIGYSMTCYVLQVSLHDATRVIVNYLSFYPMDVDALNLYGCLLELENKTIEAEEIFAKCVLILSNQNTTTTIATTTTSIISSKKQTILFDKEPISTSIKLQHVLYNYARVLFKNFKYDMAMQQLQSITMVQEHDTNWLTLAKATCLYYQQHYDKAIALLASSSSSELLLLQCMKMQYDHGDYQACKKTLEKAIKDYSKSNAIQLFAILFTNLLSKQANPTLPHHLLFKEEMIVLQSELYVLQNQIDKAKYTIQKAIHRNPSQSVLWNQFASIAIHANTSMSIELSQLCSQLLYFSNDYNSVEWIGKLYYTMGMAPMIHDASQSLFYAKSMIQKAYHFHPLQSNFTLLQQIISNTSNSHPQQQLQYIQQHYTDKTDYKLYWQLSHLLLQQGSFEKACKAMDQLIKRDVTNHVIWKQLLNILLSKQQYALALQVIQYCLEQLTCNTMDQIHLYCCMSYVYMQLQQWNECIASAQKVLQRNSDHSMAHFILGKVFVLFKKSIHQAEYHLNRCVELIPWSPLINLLLYKVYYMKENWEKAEEYLWKEKEYYGTAHVYYHLAVFALESNIKESALKMIQKSIVMDPSNQTAWQYMQKMLQPVTTSKKK